MPGMNKPVTVSVVLCTYNGSKFLEEQLRSILEQSYPIHELLIFDDASADETLAIVQRYAAQYPVIKWKANETNLGFVKNFEQAILAATGEVIAISDQDDVWLKDKIRNMINAWDGRFPLIHCGSQLFSGTPPRKIRFHLLYRFFEGTDARKIFLRNTVSGHNMLFKRSLVPLIIPFPENILYDWWMAVVAAYNGGVQFYPEILVLQRTHEHNITVAQNAKVSALSNKRAALMHCRQFMQAANIPAAHRHFAQRFTMLLEKSLQGTSFRLFSFMMQHRKLLFNYKNRKRGFFSYLKHSFLFSK